MRYDSRKLALKLLSLSYERAGVRREDSVPNRRGLHMVDIAMQAELEQEPVGIVISRGSRAEAAPRFTAYVWGPVPEDVEPASVEAA